MAINFSERDSCTLGWGAPAQSSNSQPCPSQKGKSSFLNPSRVNWRGPCFCLGHWLEMVGWAGIFVAVWLDSCCSQLLGTPHRDRGTALTLCNSSCLLLSSHHQPACPSCSLRKCKWSFAGGQSAGVGGVFVAWCDHCCLSGRLCAAGVTPHRAPLEPGQTSLLSSTKVCAEQFLFRVTSARREGPCN